jgi:hypothetical protein
MTLPGSVRGGCEFPFLTERVLPVHWRRQAWESFLPCCRVVEAQDRLTSCVLGDTTHMALASQPAMTRLDDFVTPGQ